MNIFKNIAEKVRCIHRHEVDEHPHCFFTGDVEDKRTDQKVPWYQEDGLRVGFIDIESDGLKADFSTMLTWCIKEKDGDTTYDVISRGELFGGQFDRRLIESLVNEMAKYKILIGYYSGNNHFDIPYIRSKAMHYNIDFPHYGTIYIFDLYNTVKSHLCLSRNSLANACDYLGIEGKTPIDKEIWRMAKYGEPSALKEVLSHNVADVEITEQLYDRLINTRKWSKTSI